MRNTIFTLLLCFTSLSGAFSQSAPVAYNDTLELFSNGTAFVNVLINDTDANGDPLTITVLPELPAHGTASVSGTAVINYQLNEDYTGYDQLSYAVCDDEGLCDTALLVLKVHVVSGNDQFNFLNTEGTVSLPVFDNDRIGSTEVILCDGDAVLTATGLNYTIDPTFEGTDTLCYYACDGFGYCDTARVFLKLTTPKQVFVPEAFSPNTDGYNDILRIPGIQDYPNSQLIIYNRWGDEVWRSEGAYQNTFGGNFSDGKPLPVGTYYYVLLLNTSADEGSAQSGYFTLVR